MGQQTAAKPSSPLDPESFFSRPRSLIWEYIRPVVSYLALLAVGELLLSLLPPAWLWDSVAQPVIAETGISLARLLHVVIGAPMYLYAVFHAPRIVEAFQAVHIAENEPQRLLTDGYYARVRHPFYAMNILTFFGLMFSFASVYPLILAALAGAIFYFNGYFDERQWLYPRFGEAYAEYAKRVPARCFTPVTGAYALLLIVLSIAGIVL